MMRKVHVGTMGWSYGFWQESFYPKSLATSEFLAYYAERFRSVEVDNTFYRIPRERTVLGWREQTPEGFLFSLKFPRVVTHVKMLRGCEEETRVFLERVEVLGEKLGALLLQFPYAFGSQQFPLLKGFLGSLPKEHRYVVEVRNRKLLNDDLYSVLRENGVALAWVESDFMPLVDEVTSGFVYVRWEGNRKKINGTLGKVEVDKTIYIKSWAEKLRQLAEKGIEVFGYFSKYYSGFPPSDVQEFLRFVDT